MKVVSLPFMLMMLLVACSSGIKQEDLLGTWKYLKVDKPEQEPPSSMPEDELKANHPSIVFTKEKLRMIWGGKVLSQGTYKLEYPTIAYKEELPNGGKRDIRFLIKEFKDGQLVFQTMEPDPVRVTARKE